MEELKARIKAIRALQTEMNLARQPSSELLHAKETEFHGDTNILGMPTRETDEISEMVPKKKSSTRRKSQTSSKRKSQTSAQKTKGAVPFRQLRENQQPFVDEFKRLEIQAERINQLLAARNPHKPAQEKLVQETGQSRRSNHPPEQAIFSQRQSQSLSSSSRRANVPYEKGEISQMSAIDDEDTEKLEMQAEHIKQLLAELEATIQQAGTISCSNLPSTFPSDRPDSDRAFAKPGDRRSHPAVPTTSQNSTQRLTQGNMKKALQEAAETAQALRYLANREQYVSHDTDSGMDHWMEDRQNPHSSSHKPFSIKRFGLWLRELFQVPRKPLDKLGDAVLWIVLAAVVRVGARFLIATYPAYSFLIILLMLSPAALAVYLAVFVPRTGFVSVYRLFLIMLGLLLGGKL